ncbi:MAG: glycoside hydrolase family 2 protein [Flavobacteriales bacterium]
MKILTALLAALLSIITHTAMAQTVIPVGTSLLYNAPLNALWQAKQQDDQEENWIDAKVPGCIHTDLMAAGIIKDPFEGTNENECQWVGEKNWTYRSLPFDAPEGVLRMDLQRMQFKGLDTYAIVKLNGKLLLTTDNAHRTWEADVKGILKKENNILQIDFESPLVAGERRLTDLPYPLPGEGIRAITRKPQFHFGWDWGPKLITCGITGDIRLIAYDHARFTNIHMQQLSVNEKKTEIKTTFTIHSLKEEKAQIIFEMERTGDTWLSEIDLKKGMNIATLDLNLEFAYLWWCNGQGNANLYNFNAWLVRGTDVLDQQKVRTGFRSVELITERDSIGESFYFKLNGHQVFVKGANYIPAKYFPGQTTEADYKKLLQSCKDANFNMLRVWGGGVYESDRFYELCDEMGIMVWQDFMFACSMYPADSLFVTTLIEEADQQTIRLRNHPCISLWCGNNENAEGWERWGWQQGLSEKQKNQLWRAYKDVFDLTLSKIVKKNTNTQYWESSPRFGRGDARSLTEGDSHYWGVWHDEEPFEVMNTKVPRFMSEFGMQSMPSTDAMKQMMVGRQFTYDNPGMAQHQKHNRGFKLMDKYMKAWYPEVPHDSLQQYAHMTQVVQAEGIGLGIEAQRRNMNRCGGTLYWQLNDVWPSHSWASIDYLGNRKLLHDYLGLLYAPQLISCEVKDDKVNIYWISDNYIDDEPATLQYTIENAEGKILHTSAQLAVNLTQGSHIISSFSIEKSLGKRSTDGCFVRITITGEKSGKQYDRVQKLNYKNSMLLVPHRTITTVEDKVKRIVRKKLLWELEVE